MSFTLSATLCYNPLRSKDRAIMPVPEQSPSLLPAFDRQDQFFSTAFAIVQEAIREHVFPAAAVAVAKGGHLVARKTFGSFAYSEDGEEFAGNRLPVDADTPFDVASVTKAVATTTMAMILYERGQVELDAPIFGAIPEFLADSGGGVDRRRSEVTFRNLLAHSSGLPAYEKLFLEAGSREELLRAAFAMPLAADPGSRAEYSDIGFIVLGAALERIAGESLDRFCQREIFGPLAMSATAFTPPREMRHRVPPTADERELPGQANRPGIRNQARSTFRKRVIQGEVQDENAFLLGGVAGHAGLFSTAGDLARFAQMMLDGGSPIVRPETVALFTRRESTPPATSRALGWDTPSSPSQSGKHFGSRSYGHLGYTGTSLWIDPECQLSIAMLTNRTWPDCSNQAIKQVRPRFHDAILETLRRA
jgi:serine-type D-Ala-D-Ala carboxypeptidase